MGFNYFKPREQSRPKYVYEQRPHLGALNALDTDWKSLDESEVFERASLLSTLQRGFSNYKSIKITKSDGTIRHISAPMGELKRFQNRILKLFLSDASLYHSAAFAFIPGKSAVQCARKHAEAQWLIKVDLQDFFHHIDERMVFWTFAERRVKPYKAFFLARMLTRASLEWEEITKELPRKYKRNRRHSLSEKFGVYNKRLGFLPQGSPTSGAISNLVCFDLDNRLSEVAVANNMIYTRYADDIILSSDQGFSRPMAETTLKEVLGVIRKKGFKINPTKTRIITPGSRKKILGVLVGEGNLRLPRQTRAQIDGDLRAIAKFGFRRHAKVKSLKNELALLNKVFGQLIWAHEANAIWAKPRLEALSDLANTQLQDAFKNAKTKRL